MITAATISAEARAICVRRSSGVTTKRVTQAAPVAAASARGMSVERRMPARGPPGWKKLLRHRVEIRRHLRPRRDVLDQRSRSERVAQRPVLLDHRGED